MTSWEPGEVHNEVSPREREDEDRRDDREFGPFVCENPFEEWIRQVLEGRGEYRGP